MCACFGCISSVVNLTYLKLLQFICVCVCVCVIQHTGTQLLTHAHSQTHKHTHTHMHTHAPTPTDTHTQPYIPTHTRHSLTNTKKHICRYECMYSNRLFAYLAVLSNIAIYCNVLQSYGIYYRVLRLLLSILMYYMSF
jgi:hypothetical protein